MLKINKSWLLTEKEVKNFKWNFVTHEHTTNFLSSRHGPFKNKRGTRSSKHKFDVSLQITHMQKGRLLCGNFVVYLVCWERESGLVRPCSDTKNKPYFMCFWYIPKLKHLYQPCKVLLSIKHYIIYYSVLRVIFPQFAQQGGFDEIKKLVMESSDDLDPSVSYDFNKKWYGVSCTKKVQPHFFFGLFCFVCLFIFFRARLSF